MTDTLEQLAQDVRQLEFKLEKADYGMGMPRDYRRVLELRTAVEEAHQVYLKAYVKALKESGRREI